MSVIVIMPGGFHPFHAGHASLYNSAREAFPNAEVYVAATNDTSTRPFPFSIKEKLAKIAGVEDGHFVQVKSPFQAKEITNHYNPEQDILIFVRSEKDKNESPKPGGIKKDGSPAYFQPLQGNKDKLQPFGKHAYFAYLPTVKFGPGITSATEIRNAWPTLDDRRKAAMVMSLYPVTQKNPKLVQNIIKMLDLGMGSESMNESWKSNLAGGALALGALGGIGALQNAAPNTTFQGHQLQLANPGDIPPDAKLVTDDNGKKIYAWKTTGQKNRSQWVYRPAEVKEGAPELLKQQMPMVRQIEKELAANGYQKGTEEYTKMFNHALSYYRKFGFNQSVTEGSSDTIYPNAEVIKSKNGRPVGEIYQDNDGWGCFHYKADRGYDMIDSREDAIQALKDLHSETIRHRPDYTVKGVVEGEFTKTPSGDYRNMHTGRTSSTAPTQKKKRGQKTGAEWDAIEKAKKDKEQGVAEGEEEALAYATQAHAGQTRSGGDPYITHPMRVADHIRQYKQSHNLDALISAAYLHDTIEDTSTTQEALHDLFGGLVASLVQELTSDPAQIKKMGKKHYLAHKMAAMSSYGLVIKLADRLDNVKDITTAKTPEWRHKYAAETNHILDYIEKTRALSGTHRKLIELIRAKLAEIDNPKEMSEDRDEYIDPETRHTLDFAKQHYPNSPSKQQAFMKYVQRSLKHSEQDDNKQNSEIAQLAQELAALKNQVNSMNVTESTDYIDEK